MTKDATELAKALAKRASELLPILRSQARRAFVVELTGTPKAGKTTSVHILKRFFEQCGFRVHLLNERAADCPLPMKGHFFFNAWTTCTMIAEVIETVDTNVDLMILDRGFFDALIWLELQSLREQVTDDEKKTFADFVLLERWRSLVDMTILVKVDPNRAMIRENEHLILPREGSVMKGSALAQLNGAIDTAVRMYGGHFNLLPFESDGSIRESNIDLLNRLIPALSSWADPVIAAVPKTVAAALLSKEFVNGAEADGIVAQLCQASELRRRSEFESDESFVQLVACGVISFRGRLFVFSRADKDEKTRSYGRHTLWKGCHVETDHKPTVHAIEAILKRRVQDDLHLASEFRPSLAGIAWSPNDRHLGMIFDVPVENEAVAVSMRQKEFKKLGRQSLISGVDFLEPNQIETDAKIALEPWSKSYLTSRGTK